MKEYSAFENAREKARALVDKMTVEEAASQLRYDSPAIERLGIPAYNWWNEGLHGLARSGISTVFPQAIALAATFDDGLVKNIGDITATEARAKYNAYQSFGDRDIYKGLTIWAPNINIFRDPRWGRGQETYGEDPFLTAAMGIAYTEGLQGDGDVLKTAACAKHLAVHSGPEALRHEFDAKASDYDLEDTYLYAFEELIKKAHVEGVMGAYNRVNGEPACASQMLMGKLSEWGFGGYFVSDCWAINDFHAHHMITANAVESAAMALNAGCDVNCGCCYVNLLAALEAGLVTEDRIREACVHLFTTRMKLSMFDKCEYDDIPYTVVACPEHKAKARKAAEEAIVLLENNGILPLDSTKIKTLAVIGPTADSTAVLDGNYNGTSDEYCTFLRGLQEGFDGRVIYAEGCHLFKDRTSVLAQKDDRLAEACAAAANADAVVLCVGLDASIEGEEGDTGNEFASGDKTDLRLPESQRRLVETIKKAGKPIICVVAAGSAINTGFAPDALLHAWYAGAEGGRALADIIMGRVSPSGKLPVTFYKDSDRLPEFTDYSMDGRTYRYIKDNYNVLYPFGYGLTYSKTEVSELDYNDGKASVTVTNTGSFDTDDVLQLYIKIQSDDCRENYHLCGFERITLKAGETKRCVIRTDEKALTYVTPDGRRVRCDKFTLYASTHQPDSLSCKLTGTGFVKTDQVV